MEAEEVNLADLFTDNRITKITLVKAGEMWVIYLNDSLSGITYNPATDQVDLGG